MLVNMKEMLCEARKAKRAVGAFNVANYETALAVFRAAEAEREPVIVQLAITSQSAIRCAARNARFSSIVPGTGSANSDASTRQNRFCGWP